MYRQKLGEPMKSHVHRLFSPLFLMGDGKIKIQSYFRFSSFMLWKNGQRRTQTANFLTKIAEVRTLYLPISSSFTCLVSQESYQKRQDRCAGIETNWLSVFGGNTWIHFGGTVGSFRNAIFVIPSPP